MSNPTYVSPTTTAFVGARQRASIHPDAQIGNNVDIGPFATIYGDVVIGDNCWIGPNAVIMDGVRLGSNCRIFPGAVVGAIPQDLKYSGEQTTLNIGNNVTIREYCTLNRGTEAAGATVIGDNCLLMAYTHVAHDCRIGSNVVLANNTNLAGHVEIGDWVVIGGMAGVHQFTKIGDHAMIAGGSKVRKDVPPFVRAARDPLAYAGVNKIGLERRSFSRERINQLQDLYRILFVKGYHTTQAIELIIDSIPDSEDKRAVLRFLEQSDRGVIKGL